MRTLAPKAGAGHPGLHWRAVGSGTPGLYGRRIVDVTTRGPMIQHNRSRIAELACAEQLGDSPCPGFPPTLTRGS